MRWILGFSKDIAVDENQLQARSRYIQRVSNANVSAWQFMQVNGQLCKDFIYCTSEDAVNGTFITAHIEGVYRLCSLSQVCSGQFVVANTCIWEKGNDKKLLYQIMKANRNAQLFFAKQELSMDNQHTFRQSNTLTNIGGFGFQTSLSERELFTNRAKGLETSINTSFNRVSPILFLNDLEGKTYEQFS